MATPGGFEAVLEGAGVVFGFGVLLAGSVDRGIGQADDHAPNRAEDPRRFGCANPAGVFPQGDFQAVVESTLHDPIAPFEPEQSLGLEFRQGQAAHQIHHLARPLLLPGLSVLAFDPGLQLGDQAGPGELDLAGRHFQTLQKANLQAAVVTLPFERTGLGRRPRGKNPVRRTGIGDVLGGSAG